jgi:glycerol-3-phosphate dehydrogenase
MPIVEEMHAILYEGRGAREAVEALMLRAPKAEHWS